MRRQYHSRETPQGLWIWDVHRLIELAIHLPVIEVPLARIRELDEPFWFSDADTPPTCRAILDHARLIQETDLEYSIILSADGRVMDGMHRVCKAVLAGHTTIRACQFLSDPEPDHLNVSLEDLSYEEPW